MNHGFVGYAVYFKLIEQLYLNDGKLEYNNAKIAWRLRAPDDKETLQMISSVIEDFGLFKFGENNLIYSPRALNGLEEILSKSKKAKDSALKRHNKKDNNNNSENDDLPF